MKNKTIILLLIFLIAIFKNTNAQQVNSTLTLVTTELLKKNNITNFNWREVELKPLKQTARSGQSGLYCNDPYFLGLDLSYIGEDLVFMYYEDNEQGIVFCRKPKAGSSSCLSCTGGTKGGPNSSGGWTPYVHWGSFFGSGVTSWFNPNIINTHSNQSMMDLNGIPSYGSYGWVQTSNGNWIYITQPTAPPPTKPVGVDPSDVLKDSTNNNSNKKYFVTLDDDTTKYREGSTIFVLNSAKNYKLKINKDSTVLDPSSYVWKKDETFTLAQGRDTCIDSKNNVGVFKFEVFETSNTLITVKVNIVKKPYFVFEKSNDYNFEYGWDDESIKYAMLKSDFKSEMYNHKDVAIAPKWMSVFATQTAKVKVVVKDLDKNLDSIKNFCVYIKSQNNKIKINDDTALKASYKFLDTVKNIYITSEALGSTLTNHLRDSIVPCTQDKEPIGKLYISAEVPITKKVVFVYVKTSSGNYPNNQNTQFINYLNNVSHKQLLRQWEVVIKNDVGYYPTELDLSSPAQLAVLDACTTEVQVLKYLKDEYENNYYLDSFGNVKSGFPINLLTINSNESGQDDDLGNNIKTRFYFITDLLNFSLPNGNILKGVANKGGCYGFISQEGQNSITISHEFGHLLNLFHSFYEAARGNFFPSLSKFKTTNFMDYYDILNAKDIREKFYYYQWFHPTLINQMNSGKAWVW